MSVDKPTEQEIADLKYVVEQAAIASTALKNIKDLYLRGGVSGASALVGDRLDSAILLAKVMNVVGQEMLDAIGDA